MALGLEIIDATWDIGYIINKAGIIEHGGYTVQEDGIHFQYKFEDAAALQTVITNYPTQYADEVLRPQMLAQLAALRWQKSQRFVYDGVETWAQAALPDLCAAALDMMLDEKAGITPSPVPWKLANNEWRLWGLDDLRLYGKAIRNYVQACFSKEQDLAGQIIAAADITALAAINTADGWPV